MKLALTLGYLACFQACAIPSIVRIYRRQSSEDLSVWREVLLLAGASMQSVVMHLTDTSWYIRASPIATMASVGFLLWAIWRHRARWVSPSPSGAADRA